MKVSHFEGLNTRPDVIMLGDSLTASAEWQEVFLGVSIVNRGIDGETTFGLRGRLEEVIKRRPGGVFLMIGVNDFMVGESVERVRDRYQEIIKRLSETGDIHVFVQSTILQGGNVGLEKRRRVTELNRWLREYCDRHEHATFIDLNHVLAPEGFLSERFTLDGIHLNGDGYREWARLIEPMVRQIGSREE
ncbi:GDSL-type esterase/lipase family protein [Haloferula chungangensis]|uniref:GDSL-type esterase/lipase family protein n=1 Tax=Haloferula chungangensis TaxID=1048331 RepID=A0ABW2L8N9_9BACT